MALISQKFKLNLIPGYNLPPVRVHCSQYDTGRELRFELYDGDDLYTIPSSVTAEIRGLKKDGNGFAYSETENPSIVKKEGAEVIITQGTDSVQMTACCGNVVCELVLYEKTGERVGTANFVLHVEKAACDDEAVASETDIYDMLEHLQESVSAAETSAAESASSAAMATEARAYIYSHKVAPEQTTFIKQIVSGNMFDKNAVTRGYRIGTNGEIVNDTSYSVSDYIPVDAGSQYTMNYRESRAFYDFAHTLIGWESYSTGNTATAPDGAAYMRVSVNNGNLSKYSLVPGTAKPDDGLPYAVTNRMEDVEVMAENVSGLTIEKVAPDGIGKESITFIEEDTLTDIDVPASAVKGKLESATIDAENIEGLTIEKVAPDGIGKEDTTFIVDDILTGVKVPAAAVTGKLESATIDGENVEGLSKEMIFPNKVGLDDTAFLIPFAGMNLFNPYRATSGVRLQSGGVIKEAEGYCLSDYIPIESGKTYTLGAKEGRAYYTETKELLLFESYTVGKQTVAPEGAVYLRVNCLESYRMRMMVVEGTELPDTYIPVEYYLSEVRVEAAQVDDIELGYINARRAGMIPGDRDVAASNLAVFKELAKKGVKIYFPAGIYYIGGAVEFKDRMYLDLDEDAELYLASDTVLDYFISTITSKNDIGNDYAYTDPHLGSSYIHGGSINADFKAKTCIRMLGMKKFDLAPKFIRNFTTHGVFIGASNGHPAQGHVHDCNIQNSFPSGWEEKYPHKEDGTVDYANTDEWPTDVIYGIYEDKTSDMRYDNIKIKDVNVGMFVGDPFISDVHMWLGKAVLVPGSVFAIIKGNGQSIFNHIMMDTVQFGFKPELETGKPHYIVYGLRVFDNERYYPEAVRTLYPHQIFVASDRTVVQVMGMVSRCKVDTEVCDTLHVAEGSRFYGVDVYPDPSFPDVVISNVPELR